MKSKTITPLLIIALIILSFISGSLWMRLRNLEKGKEVKKGEKEEAQPSVANFNPEKKEKPEVKFFVMSFCPFGNQAEKGLEPVYRLLKDKVLWQPRYVIYNKDYCNNMVYDEKRCQQLVDAGRVPDLETCKKYFPFKTTDECVKKFCLQEGENYYCSMHGIGEANQNVREICVYKNFGMDKYWDFVAKVNDKCNPGNVEDCWQSEAEEVGLDVSQITQCQENQALALLREEVTEDQKYKVRGSPTVYINNSLYKGGRQPEDYKKAICAGFKEQPEECKKVLSSSTKGPSIGGCK